MTTSNALRTALCQASQTELLTALCFELPADGTVPDWIKLIPAGEFQGFDQRAWINDQPDQVLAVSLDGRDKPLDWEHSTQLKIPKGEKAPAAGWIDQLESRNGEIWGHVSWNAAGRADVASGQYKYFSPVFDYEQATGRVVRFVSAGLTNRPNLLLTALNAQQSLNHSPPETTMELSEFLKLLAAAWQQPDTLTTDQALNHAKQLNTDLATARNAQQPSLSQYVPRADYDQVLNRATNAEQQLADNAKAERDQAIQAEVNDAIEAGKIAPASKDFYVRACNHEGGLDEFRKFIDGAPVIAGASGLDTKKPADTSTALNAEEQKIAELFGNSADDLQKYGG
ncbi:phage protease [Oceanobacter kriegii]|uniref:phage protease n=1 Tax=Oceanobacter kriegii TaxID=64972 RepID=UPI000410A480|nr:phage protease [Oceanobacter kriegii]